MRGGRGARWAALCGLRRRVGGERRCMSPSGSGRGEAREGGRISLTTHTSPRLNTHNHAIPNNLDARDAQPVRTPLCLQLGLKLFCPPHLLRIPLLRSRRLDEPMRHNPAGQPAPSLPTDPTQQPQIVLIHSHIHDCPDSLLEPRVKSA